MENEAQAENGRKGKQVWIEEENCQLVDANLEQIEALARVKLSRNKAVDWCIRFAIEHLPK